VRHLLPPLLVLLLAALSVGASCSRRPIAAGPADGDVCGHLAALGCATGVSPSCGVALARARTLGTVPDACLLAAHDRAGVRACGPLVECP
jgi:hypothetical protein